MIYYHDGILYCNENKLSTLELIHKNMWDIKQKIIKYRIIAIMWFWQRDKDVKK